MLIADAELTYLRVLDGRVRLHWALVEVDRATMALETLVAKLGRYVRLHEYAGPPSRRRIGAGPLWREHYPYFPTLLVVLANASHRRLWNRRWLVQSLWERDHADRGKRIDVRVCIYSELMEHGLFAPVLRTQSRRHRRPPLPRPAPHLRHPHGRRRRLAPHPAGVDGPPRHHHHPALRRLRAERARGGDGRGGVSPTPSANTRSDGRLSSATAQSVPSA